MHYIHHYLELPILALSNDYLIQHKFEVLFFKSDRTALVVQAEHNNTKSSSVSHLKPTGKDRQRQFISKYGLWQVVFHNGLDHNCDRTLTFLVKEFQFEVVIFGSIERQLGRVEGKGITAYAVQAHCNRLKINRNFDLPQFSCQRWLFPSPCILSST